MIPWLSAIMLAGGFILLMKCFRLEKYSHEVGVVARRALEVIRSSSIPERRKEALLKESSGRLFWLAALLLGGGAVALGLPVGALWLVSQTGVIDFNAAVAVAASPSFLATCVALAVVVVALRSRKRAEGSAAYSSIDRALHRMAFKSRVAQIAVADLEERIYGEQLRACSVERPVFITALPRSGTTLLLRSISRMPECASHRYRDMPFVLTPCLWSEFWSRFPANGSAHERLHGDGVTIDNDSPEALEEVVWMPFWASHYRQDRIRPWSSVDRSDEFERFLHRHMRKIALLRQGVGATGIRYVSKNNLNVARVAFLARLFPDVTIIVPFRDPLPQIASLLRQHRHFLNLHQENRFISEYMRAIGHFDFGRHLRPVDFGGWVDRFNDLDPTLPRFWLEYWIVTYRHLLAQDLENLLFVGYDALCRTPHRAWLQVAEALEFRDPDRLPVVADPISERPSPQLALSVLPEASVRTAVETFHLLSERSVVR